MNFRIVIISIVFSIYVFSYAHSQSCYEIAKSTVFLNENSIHCEIYKKELFIIGFVNTIGAESASFACYKLKEINGNYEIIDEFLFTPKNPFFISKISYKICDGDLIIKYKHFKRSKVFLEELYSNDFSTIHDNLVKFEDSIFN